MGKALEIGAETKAEEICNIEFRNSNVIHSTGAVLDCFNVDWAHLHTIAYRNITVEYDDVAQKPLIQTSDNHVYENRDINYFPCLISAVLMQHIEYSKGSDKLGKIENIIFENIYVTSKHIQSICIKGEDNTHVVSNLLIRNIFLNKKSF